jgi:hypothetical protein
MLMLIIIIIIIIILQSCIPYSSAQSLYLGILNASNHITILYTYSHVAVHTVCALTFRIMMMMMMMMMMIYSQAPFCNEQCTVSTLSLYLDSPVFLHSTKLWNLVLWLLYSVDATIPLTAVVNKLPIIVAGTTSYYSFCIFVTVHLSVPPHNLQ